MPVPLLDFTAQHAALHAQFVAAFDEAARTGRFILGPAVADFEAALAHYCGARHAIAISSGTDALLAALMVLGMGPGDEVITSPFTFFATAGCVARVGAKAVFVDIDPLTYNLDATLVERAITPRTRAIMPVHLYGQCADMAAINALARTHGLHVIEDAAQAIGATDPAAGPGKAGSFGDIGAMSFYPTKNLSAFGDAGACLTSDDELAAKLRQFRNHGQTSEYLHSFVGGNFRLDAIQASVLAIKLPHLDGWTQQRREIACRYHELLADAPVSLPGAREGVRHVYHQYTLALADRATRDGLVEHLKQRHIGCKVYYPVPLHRQPCFASMGQANADLPHTHNACDRVLSLPIYPGLTADQQQEVADAVTGYFR